MADTVIRSAQQELVALALAVRTDWDPIATEGACVAASTAGWPWIRTLVTLVALIADEDGTPRDLLEATRDPRQRSAGCGADPTPEYMAAKNAIGGHDDAA